MSGPLLILICSALWATDAIFRVPLSRHISSTTIVFIEHVFCVLITFPLFYLKRREVRLLNTKAWSSLAFIGIMGSAIALILFTLSYRYINPSVAILLQKLQPIVAVLCARFFLSEKPPKYFYFLAFCALISSTMVSIPEIWHLDTLSNPMDLFYSKVQPHHRLQGILFAIAAATCWGASTVFGRWVSLKVSFQVTTFLRFAWALAALLILFSLEIIDSKLPVSDFYNYFLNNPKAIQSILYMSIVSGVSAMYLYYAGLRKTPASVAAFAEMFFPVAAIVINWKFLNQPLSGIQSLGAIFLILSILAISLSSSTFSNSKRL